MRLYEYHSKKIFQQYGIPIAKGRLTTSACEAKQIAADLGGNVVIKAQVLATGRGRAGGIRLAKSPQEAEEQAANVLGMEIKGYPVRKVLVDEAIAIDREMYVAIIIDWIAKKPVLITSAEGGTYIEEIAQQSPEKIKKIAIDPVIGLREYQIRETAAYMDLPREYWRAFNQIVQGLWQAFIVMDASLAEINPLVVSSDHRLIALDGKMIVDDNASFRHPEFPEMLDPDLMFPEETETRKYRFSYLKLDGNIGCLVNGAGLAMSIMDTIRLYGGAPANFMDIGGGASADKVLSACKIIYSDPDVKAVLINIFGGLTHCDEAAEGILRALEEIHPRVPTIVRLAGTNAGLGLKLLKGTHLIIAETLLEGVHKSIAAAKGEWNEHID